MTGASATPSGSRPSDGAQEVSTLTGFDPSRDEDDYWLYEDDTCWNCGGEGFVYGCSWDWQCDTYDEGEGTCLCSRRCTVCHPQKPSAELAQLQAVLAIAMEAREGTDPKGLDGEAATARACKASPDV